MKKAFTLIELLISISIIAVMISFILPTLSSSKEKSRAISCSINLKNTIESVFLYRNDYKEMFPFADSPADIRIPNLEPYQSLNSYLGETLPFYEESNTVKTFSPFSCPSDNTISKNTGFSYTYNIWDLMLLWPGENPQYAVSKTLMNYEDEVIFMDSDSFHGSKKNIINVARVNGQVASFLSR